MRVVMQKVESQVVKEKVWSKDAKALNLWPTTEVYKLSFYRLHKPITCQVKRVHHSVPTATPIHAQKRKVLH